MQTPLRRAGLQDQADDPLGLLVGVQLIIAVGASDLPPRGRMPQCTAPRLVAHPFPPSALHAVEFRFAQHPTQP